jgi:hypothetical protein
MLLGETIEFARSDGPIALNTLLRAGNLPSKNMALLGEQAGDDQLFLNLTLTLATWFMFGVGAGVVPP